MYRQLYLDVLCFLNYFILFHLAPQKDLRLEIEDSTKSVEQNQSMHHDWVIFQHLFGGGLGNLIIFLKYYSTTVYHE